MEKRQFIRLSKFWNLENTDYLEQVRFGYLYGASKKLEGLIKWKRFLQKPESVHYIPETLLTIEVNQHNFQIFTEFSDLFNALSHKHSFVFLENLLECLKEHNFTELEIKY